MSRHLPDRRRWRAGRPLAAAPLLLALATTVASAAPPAVATGPSASDLADVRCVYVISTLAGTIKEPGQSAAIVAAAYYFFGRVEGHVPDAVLEDLLYAQEQAMSPELRTSETQRCFKQFAQRAEEVKDLGHRLELREQAARPAPPAEPAVAPAPPPG